MGDDGAASAHLFTLVLPQLQALDDLSVDELRADLVLHAVVPGGEDLLAEQEAPGCVLLLLASRLHLLLALGDGVHQVLATAAQSPHLEQERAGHQVMEILTAIRADCFHMSELEANSIRC